jgi:hypothetical protein
MGNTNEHNPADAASPVTGVDKYPVEPGPRPGMVRNYVAERKLMQFVRFLEHEIERLKRNGSDHAQTVESILRALEHIIHESPPLDNFVRAEPLASRTVHEWPWGTHETKLLRHLADAGDRFWRRYDPADPSTGPENSHVVDWLRERGVSARTAEVMATILRADDLPSGPRKK